MIKIAAIFTGGTIGCRAQTDGALSPETSMRYALLEAYHRQYPHGNVTFSPSAPMQILSESMDGATLTTLIHHVSQRLCDPTIDGIVILHGSDTIAYTAAVLGYLLGTHSLPVVLVSSAFPIDDPRANGIENLHGAVRLIESHQGGGVFVSNRNDGAAILLHRGTRILQQPVCSAAIDSIHNQYYGSIVEDRFVKNPAYRATCGDCLMPLSETVQLRDSAAILRISPCVGMCYPEIPAQTRVILHGSYHSGTLCVREDLHTFAMHAYDREIPFYLTGTTAHEKAYATMERYAALHIQTLPDAAPIAMYCRLWLALSQTSLSIPIWMQTPAGDDGLVCATSHPIKEESL